jgi:hypothetical protein
MKIEADKISDTNIYKVKLRADNVRRSSWENCFVGQTNWIEIKFA